MFIFLAFSLLTSAFSYQPILAAVDNANTPPEARAGPNLIVQEGNLVTLNGSASSDPDGDLLSFNWTQVKGKPVVLSDTGSIYPTFIAPAVKEKISLLFQLTVSDGLDYGIDSVRITVLGSEIEQPTDEIENNNSTSSNPGAPVEEKQDNATLVATELGGTAKISGTVYLDENSNGHRDESEGLGDVEMKLFGSDNIAHFMELVNKPGPFVVNHDASKIYMIPGLSTPSGALSIIDTNDGELINEIPIGEVLTRKAAIAIDPVRELVYVANSHENRIYIINGTSDTLVDDISISQPASMEVDVDSNTLYVLSELDSDQSSIKVIDGDTGEIESVPLNFPVSSFALDTSAKIMYLTANLESNSKIRSYDLSFEQLAELTLDGEGIEGIRVNSDNHALYAVVFNFTIGNKHLAVINTTDQLQIGAKVPLNGFVSDIAIDPARDLIFSVGGASLSVIDGDSNTIVATLHPPERSTNLAVDSDSGDVYVASFGNPQDNPPIFSLSILSGSVVYSTLSEEDGSFSFVDLPEGSYTLTEVMPPLLALKHPETGFHNFTLTEGEEITDLDFGNTALGNLGKLTVRSGYFGGTEVTALIKVFSDSVDVEGRTPFTFSLAPGDYTIVAHDVAPNFFSQWSDTGSTESSRNVTVTAGSELTLHAVYVNLDGAEVVTVNVNTTLLDENGNETPLAGVETQIFADNNIGNVLDRGASPRIYRLANGSDYNIFAINSENLVFDHWVDPFTQANDTSRELLFRAKEGLTLKAVYRESESDLLTISVTSKLTNGTVLTNMFNKIECSRVFETCVERLLDQGFTPNEYHVEKEGFYTVAGADLDGLVIDHWEAEGGPNIKRIVFSDKYSFNPMFEVDVVDSLTAVYRAVPDDDFASVPVNFVGEKGENVMVEIPSKINNGISLTLEEVSTAGNVTAAETSVVSDFDLFRSISLIQGNMTHGNATLIVAATEPGDDNITSIAYRTSGPVLRINDAYLTTSGDKEVTIHYDPTQIPAGQEPKMLHFNGTHWEDVTLSVNTTEHTITGKLATLSPFVYAIELTGPGGGFDDGQGANIIVGPDNDVTVSPSLGRNGQLFLNFESISSGGTLVIDPKPLDDDENIGELKDKGYITPDSKFGIGGVKVLVGEAINAAVGTLFDTDVRFDYSGPIEVTIPYDPKLLPIGTSESDIKFLHHTGSRWEEVTASVDDSANTVTAELDSLSPILAAVLIGQEPPSGVGGGGHGSSAEPPTGPIDGVEPVSTVHLEQGVDIKASALGVSGNGTEMRFVIQHVTSPGNITVTTKNSSMLSHLFVNTAGQRAVTVLGSNFTALGSLYNVTADSQFASSGRIDITIPYNMATIDASSESNVTEADVRFIYYNGSAWEDSTIYVNAITDTVTGRVNSLSSPLLITAALVQDKTFGSEYFEEYPLKKISIKAPKVVFNEIECVDNELEDRVCAVTLTTLIRNAQRTNQTFVFLEQTTDEKGIAQSIEWVSGSLERAETLQFNLTWNLVLSDTSTYHRVQIIVVDYLDGETSILAEKRELDLRF